MEKILKADFTKESKNVRIEVKFNYDISLEHFLRIKKQLAKDKTYVNIQTTNYYKQDFKLTSFHDK